MQIISWNVNGIRAVENKNALNPILDKYRPDAVCIQETKAQPEQIKIDFGDYNSYWYSAIKKGYAGVGILSQQEPIQIINGLPERIVSKYPKLADDYGNTANEGRVITAEFEKFNLISVYTPNVKEDLSRVPTRYTGWDPAFYQFVTELENIKPVIFCGDINVAHTEDDLARPKENKGKKGFTDEEREGFQKFIDAKFIDSFRVFTKGNGHYTWWSHWGNARAKNIGWRIDYCMVSPKLKSNIKAAKIYPEMMGSDHCPTSLKINV